jgi:site-specific recombinase XerD
MNKKFSLLFYLKRNKTGLNGLTPIYLRITVDGQRSEVSTQRLIDSDRWATAKGRAKGTQESARILNTYLDTLQAKVYEHHQQLVHRNKMITANSLKNAFLGITEKQKSILEVYSYHNSRMEKLVGKQYASSTYTKYKTSYKHLKDFIKWKFIVDDLMLGELTFGFITEYEFYLRSVKNIDNNCSVKYLTHLRKVVRLAVDNDWVPKDPFVNFKMQNKEVEKGFLTEHEIKLLIEKEFSISRLEQVRDVFAFCCFTGLAFIDVFKLAPDQIVRGIDGDMWIHTKRTKTETRTHIPLLPHALEIIEKYKDDPNAKIQGKVLPVGSNQKMNAYLKEVGTICGIEKKLTMHVARHTFATFALTNGVPLETVGKMLGHRSIKTTQHYAKIIDRKVADDMKILKSKMIPQKTETIRLSY